MGTEAIMEEDLQRNTNHLLHRLGLTANYRGYFYVSYGIVLCAKEQERLLLVTKRLYPEVAKRYGTNWKAVERNIRTSIRIVWSKNPHKLQQLTGCPISSRPTAAHFIAILVYFVQTSASKPEKGALPAGGGKISV